MLHSPESLTTALVMGPSFLMGPNFLAITAKLM